MLASVVAQCLYWVAAHCLRVPRGLKCTLLLCGPLFLRAPRCYLAPGDSAMGLRLPLDSQPWVSANEYPWIHAIDPTQAFEPLAAWKKLAALRKAKSAAPQAKAPEKLKSAGWVTRTAAPRTWGGVGVSACVPWPPTVTRAWARGGAAGGG